MYDLHILYLLHYIIFFIDTVFFIQLHFLSLRFLILFFFFFFQAEDGIRDKLVTGVQTCALPIFISGLCPHTSRRLSANSSENTPLRQSCTLSNAVKKGPIDLNYMYPVTGRSEERRVGKECRSRWSRYQ